MKYILLFLCSLKMLSQHVITFEGEKINELDAGRNKIGMWKVVDHEKGINIIGEMTDDQFSSIDYYRYGKLIATQKKDGQLILYNGKERIYARLVKEKNTRIVKENGEEMDAETAKAFFQAAVVKPYFYGGGEVLRYALMKNVDKVKVKNHYGMVKVKFVVDDYGFVEKAEVVESDDPFLNEEAVRAIQLLPRWQPGFEFGKFVKCMYSLSINFGNKPK